MEIKCPVTCLGSVSPSAGNVCKIEGSNYITMWNSYLLGRMALKEREEMKKVIDDMGMLSAQAQHLNTPVTSFDRLNIFRSQRLYVLWRRVDTSASSSAQGLLTGYQNNENDHAGCNNVQEQEQQEVLEDSNKVLGTGVEALLQQQRKLKLVEAMLMEKQENGVVAREEEEKRRTTTAMAVIEGMLKVGTKDLFIRRYDGTVHEMSPLCVLDFYVHYSYQRSGKGHLLFQHMLSKEGLCAHQMGYDRPSTKLISFLQKHYGLIKYVPQATQFVVFDAYFERMKEEKVAANKNQHTKKSMLEKRNTIFMKDNWR
ncbi:hypothetical protein KP509_02G085500 [Ceratopteris richardii]|uniref:Alpha-tubulin N-acetyltransferase n=1 Tax=Ceratopteris richardii TaxID=49495 RepID=A0A8T2VG88_CERRI|nr:hypothetical protein KP509_02G085500 [Ceratopteris richardii]